MQQRPGAVEQTGGQQSLQPVPVEGGEVGQQLGEAELAGEVGGEAAPGLAQARSDEGGLGLVVLSLAQPLDHLLHEVLIAAEQRHGVQHRAALPVLHRHELLLGHPDPDPLAN